MNASEYDAIKVWDVLCADLAKKDIYVIVLDKTPDFIVVRAANGTKIQKHTKKSLISAARPKLFISLLAMLEFQLSHAREKLQTLERLVEREREKQRALAAYNASIGA